MHFSTAISLLTAATTVTAAPWTAGFKLTGCNDLSGVSLPSSSLPGPGNGDKLVQVTIGVGHQLYTCADENSAPAPNGAIATLYDANCFAVQNPDQLHTFPPLLVQTPNDQEAVIVSLLSRVAKSQMIVGHHYFGDKTMPVFQFNSAYGDRKFVSDSTTAVKSPAPAGSSMGQTGQAYGAVAWLRLSPRSGVAENKLDLVYRIETAGGAPPPSCKGQGANIKIPYAAEYWFYNN